MKLYEFQRDWMGYAKGTRAGFSDAQAAKMVQSGIVKPVDAKGGQAETKDMAPEASGTGYETKGSGAKAKG